MSIVYQTNQAARASLLSGIQQLGELVCITMGPKGRNVALDRLWANPTVIHDGVSVAKEIDLPDPFENMGAQIVKEAASKTNDRVGDGTTTATLLAWKLIAQGMQLIDAGANPMLLKEGMDQAVTAIVQQLTTIAQQVTTGDIAKVATISAANPEIGQIIATALERVGQDGVITVEEGLSQTTSVEYKDGMLFDKGFGQTGTAFVTDLKKQIAEIDHPMLLYTDLPIDSLQDFADFLDHMVTEEDRNIVIIADGFAGMTLPTLIDNHKRGVIRALAIQAPSFGLKRIWLLEDMAALTGGTVITRQSGRTLGSIAKTELGRADKVWADADNTKIIGGQGTSQAVQERIAILKGQLTTQDSAFEQQQLRTRIARLSGGAAIIKVGALTEAELKDKKERITDAVEATKAALAEGIVPGGGIALLNCQNSLQLPIADLSDDDVLVGYALVLEVLDQPIRQLLTNAGEDPDAILKTIRTANQPGYGYDLLTDHYGQMQDMGIIDPLRVTRQALENAVSVSGMVLTINGLITLAPSDPRQPANTPL